MKIDQLILNELSHRVSDKDPSINRGVGWWNLRDGGLDRLLAWDALYGSLVKNGICTPIQLSN